MSSQVAEPRKKYTLSEGALEQRRENAKKKKEKKENENKQKMKDLYERAKENYKQMGNHEDEQSVDEDVLYMGGDLESETPETELQNEINTDTPDLKSLYEKIKEIEKEKEELKEYVKKSKQKEIEKEKKKAEKDQAKMEQQQIMLGLKNHLEEIQNKKKTFANIYDNKFTGLMSSTTPSACRF